MIDKQFKKEAFKKSVEDNVKISLHAKTGRSNAAADFPGSELHGKGCYH